MLHISYNYTAKPSHLRISFGLTKGKRKRIVVSKLNEISIIISCALIQRHFFTVEYRSASSCLFCALAISRMRIGKTPAPGSRATLNLYDFEPDGKWTAHSTKKSSIRSDQDAKGPDKQTLRTY